MGDVLSTAALAVFGPMVGNELAVAAVVHPAVSRLPGPAHAAAAQLLARAFNRLMPPWYAASLGLMVATAAVSPVRSPRFVGAAVAAGLVAATIVATLFALLPLAQRAARWDIDALPPDWRAERRTWDRRHAIRVAVLVVALAALAAGAAAG